MQPALKRNFEVFSATDWLAALSAHTPNAGKHLVRYFGWYSIVGRGKRWKAEGRAKEHRGTQCGNSIACKVRAGCLVKQV